MSPSSFERWLQRIVVGSTVTVLGILGYAQLQSSRPQSATAEPVAARAASVDVAASEARHPLATTSDIDAPLLARLPATAAGSTARPVALEAQLLTLCAEQIEPELCRTRMAEWVAIATPAQMQAMIQAMAHFAHTDAEAAFSSTLSDDEWRQRRQSLGEELFRQIYGNEPDQQALRQGLSQFLDGNEAPMAPEARKAKLRELFSLTEQAKASGSMTESEAALVQLKLLQASSASHEEFLDQAMRLYEQRLQ